MVGVWVEAYYSEGEGWERMNNALLERFRPRHLHFESAFASLTVKYDSEMRKTSDKRRNVW